MVALVARNNFVNPKLLTAPVIDIFLREVGVIVGDRRARGLELLHRRRELLFLHVESGFVDCDLLAVVAVVELRQQRAGRHPLTFVEWQRDDARLHGLEADDALVGFDVAGDQQAVGRGRDIEENRIASPGACPEQQNSSDDDSPCLHAGLPGRTAVFALADELRLRRG